MSGRQGIERVPCITGVVVVFAFNLISKLVIVVRYPFPGQDEFIMREFVATTQNPSTLYPFRGA